MSRRRKHAKNRKGPAHLAVCRGALRTALGGLAGYALLLLVAVVGGLSETLAQGPWLTLLWGAVLALAGYATLCLYGHQRVARWGAVGAILLVAGVVTWFPPTEFISMTLQALGLAGFSLVLFDLGRVLDRPVEVPGGLIFLAVVGVVLNTPITVLAGLALLAAGALLAWRRLGL